ncbi:MAG: DNA mismatch repair protein MutS [Selenomonadaceae bacterium]|nr:DNA mismatch repair protein MutS [Selenomonadaceae bacterium]
MNRAFYDNEREIDLTEQKDLHRREKKVIWARIGIFLAVIISVMASVEFNHDIGYLGAAILVMIFIRLVSYHNYLKSRQRFLLSRLNVLNSYIVRARGTWRNRSNDGSTYLKYDRPQDTDLYIFGPGSIFQYICAARTKRGRDKLAESLSPNPPSFSKVRVRQRGVSEILQRPRLSLDLEAFARLMPNNHDTTELLKSVEEVSPQFSKIFYLRFLTLPILILTGFLSAKEIISPVIFASIPIIFLTISFAMFSRTSELLKPLQMFSKELRLYQSIFERLELTDFNSSCLRTIKNSLTDEVSAAQKLKMLSLLSRIVNARKNPVVYILGNAIFLFDFFCAAAFLSWRKTAEKHLEKWLDAWAEVEVLISLASIGQTRTTYCFPTLLEGAEPRISAKNLSSLLIADKKAVSNDVDLKAGTTIITGANMSGKTTWIRTIAGAVILAYAGAPVCAENFSVSKFAVFTSIRVNDDITQGLSTFYAELLRIKIMIEYNKKKLPMLICIDEIFKGTNEADRLMGAREAVRRLTNERCITLVTTHDFELCEMPNVLNAHFEEYYEGEEIKFDFKLREGRCKTTNAKYLLKMAGILEDE